MTLTQFVLGVPTPGSKELLVLRLTIVGSSLLAGLLGALLAYGITKPVRRVIVEAQKMIRYTETDLPPLKAENEVGALSTLFNQAFVSFVELVQAREILDNLHEGIVALDEKGKIAGMNLQAQKLLGISLAEGQQKSFRDILSESSHNHILYEFVQSALRDRSEKTHNRLLFRSLSGKEHLLSVKVTPLQLERKPRAFVGVILTLKEYPAGFQDLPEIIGQSEQLKEVLSLAAKVAPTDSTVLLMGESGTGKELVANAIHRLSRRKHGPFIKLNCAAIPEALLESELFGHERGAFTGAVNKKPGMFDLADGGTIFLDEIGDMSLSTQAKLLRVLQEKEFTPVGGEERKRVDVRIIAATNSNLLSDVQRGKFREDLYYRVNGITIGMPPLRARKPDIPLLANHFLEEMAKQAHVQKKSLSRPALEYLLSYAWPGNIRELRNAMERALSAKRRRPVYEKRIVPE
jgi:PAS domain S-box-containing protein